MTVCQAGDAGSDPDVAGALVMLDRALAVLATADAASLPTASQAEVLRALGRAQARQTAAHARFLGAFDARGGYGDDGQGTPGAWLRWQTRITRPAAAAAVAWNRRLHAHPVIADALAAGQLSVSWARVVCGWSDRLPAGQRENADGILVQAARGGAELADLAGLAEEMHRRSTGPDDDRGDGFEDRYFDLDVTFQGAGRAEGDLSPACAASLEAVLAALSKKAGPEDTRSARQRRHDALEEMCRRLIAAGMVPDRAGQPTHIQVHLTLSQLRGLPGGADAEAAWMAGRASQPGWLTGPEADAAACDAAIVPVVTGHPDAAALDRLTSTVLAGQARGGSPKAPPSVASRRRLARALLGLAAGALSGPGGLAAWLRTGLGDPVLATRSLPLDVGAASEIIPAHLRRAVAARHQHCGFPGCDQPASTCQIHHIIPRARGGPTTLANLLPLCGFHHLVAIHRWQWTITLQPDGTTIATSPDGTRTLHSHGPPTQAA